MSRTKFYQTFSADSYPITPQLEVPLDEATKLATYYQATFDANDRVQEFVKILREGDASESTCWVTQFSESYEYWPSGRLKLRKLIRRDGTIRTWSFEDRPSTWTGTIGDWSRRWLRGRGFSETGLASRLLACHEIISQMESRVFEEAIDRQSTEVWAYATIAKRIPDFKALLLLVYPRSNPRISLLAANEKTGLKSARGFDEFFSLGALAPAWEYMATIKTLEPTDLTFAVRMEPEGKEWLKANDVASFLAIPIRAFEAPSNEGAETESFAAPAGQLEVAAHLVLWLSTSPDNAQAAAVNSSFRHIGHFVQIVIAMATAQQPIVPKRKSNPSGQH